MLKDITPDEIHTPLTAEATQAIAALARRQKAAGGLLMKAVNAVGSGVEDGMRLLPAPARRAIDAAARRALTRSYDAAARSREGVSGLLALVTGDRSHKALAAVSGAVGGAGGLLTSLAELPITTTIIFRAVQAVAEAHGEDPSSEATRIECLRVFGAGGEEPGDEGVDTAFLGARLSLTGPAINRLIARIAPRFGAVLSQKLATQAVPILGAAAGAGTNWAFVDYYVEMAHVHFGLRALERHHGRAASDEFHRQLAALSAPAVRRA